MKTILRQKKTVWYGIYHTFTMFNAPNRVLEYIVSSYNEALKRKNKMIADMPLSYTRDNLMIEEVDVTMRAWKV